MVERYFEDFTVGEIMVSASAALSEAEIVAFARSYDPQPFHLDPEAARESPDVQRKDPDSHVAAPYHAYRYNGSGPGGHRSGSCPTRA